MLTLSVACEAIKKGTMSVQDAAMGLDAASQMQASARKNDGVTYTPWDVACQVVAQADPKPSESWLDTSIGRGMFLWATLHHMQDSGASLVDIEDFLHHRLHAVELNEQAAIDAGLAGYCHQDAFQIGGEFLCCDEFLGGSLFQLGALGFKFLQRSRRGALGLAVGNQEIAGVAVLDLDEIAQAVS